jgi:UDP-2,3-diacylglucosamine pyrophosphatase LpxH
MPARAAVFLANRYRGISKRKTARMVAGQEGRLSTILDGVRMLLDREAFDYVVCGHIHHLGETPVRGGAGTATLLTTGAWEAGPNYVHFDGDRAGVRRFAPPPEILAGEGMR